MTVSTSNLYRSLGLELIERHFNSNLYASHISGHGDPSDHRDLHEHRRQLLRFDIVGARSSRAVSSEISHELEFLA